MQLYAPGTAVKFTARFRTVDGEMANPTTVLLTLKPPSGPNIVVTISNPDIGVFVGTHTLDMPGTWYARWTGTGTLEAASFDVPITVAETRFT